MRIEFLLDYVQSDICHIDNKKKIIEGSLSELIALISSEKNIVSRFEIYSKWEWS